MSKNIYVNLPVKNVEKTKEFYSNLGFEIKKEFTGEHSVCVIIGENIFAMMLSHEHFSSFTPGRNIINTEKDIEVLNAISLESREEVDKMIEKVIESGGKEFRDKQDHGWMYLRAFQDLDGHVWEIGFMDESKMPEEMKKKIEEK